MAIPALSAQSEAGNPAALNTVKTKSAKELVIDKLVPGRRVKADLASYHRNGDNDYKSKLELQRMGMEITRHGNGAVSVDVTDYRDQGDQYKSIQPVIKRVIYAAEADGTVTRSTYWGESTEPIAKGMHVDTVVSYQYLKTSFVPDSQSPSGYREEQIEQTRYPLAATAGSMKNINPSFLVSSQPLNKYDRNTQEGEAGYQDQLWIVRAAARSAGIAMVAPEDAVKSVLRGTGLPGCNNISKLVFDDDPTQRRADLVDYDGQRLLAAMASAENQQVIQ